MPKDLYGLVDGSKKNGVSRAPKHLLGEGREGGREEGAKWVGEADKIGLEGLQTSIARLVASGQTSALLGETE